MLECDLASASGASASGATVEAESAVTLAWPAAAAAATAATMAAAAMATAPAGHGIAPALAPVGAGSEPDQSDPSTAAGTGVTLEQSAQPVSDRPWQTVVWDDPVNLMSYVSYVFQLHFGYDEAKAEELMLRVHRMGSAVVAEGGREGMEMHVEAMHGYGLWATLREAGAQ